MWVIYRGNNLYIYVREKNIAENTQNEISWRVTVYLAIWTRNPGRNAYQGRSHDARTFPPAALSHYRSVNLRLIRTQALAAFALETRLREIEADLNGISVALSTFRDEEPFDHRRTEYSRSILFNSKLIFHSRIAITIVIKKIKMINIKSKIIKLI